MRALAPIPRKKGYMGARFKSNLTAAQTNDKSSSPVCCHLGEQHLHPQLSDSYKRGMAAAGSAPLALRFLWTLRQCLGKAEKKNACTRSKIVPCLPA